MSLQVDSQRRWMTKFSTLLLSLLETSRTFRFLWIMKQVSRLSVSHAQDPPARKELKVFVSHITVRSKYALGSLTVIFMQKDFSEAWGCELQCAFQIPYIAFEVRQAFQSASRKIGFELHGELLFQTASQAVSYTCSVLGSCAVK